MPNPLLHECAAVFLISLSERVIEGGAPVRPVSGNGLENDKHTDRVVEGNVV